MGAETLGLRRAQCRCGQVALELTGPEMIAAACHCESCHRAAEGLERLPGAPRVLDAEGGTQLVLYRKDRVTLLKGEANLRGYRLTPKSGTLRVVASCCDTPLWLDPGAFWVSLYRGALGPDAPVITLRLNRKEPAPAADGVPSHRSVAFGFAWRLITTFVALGFRTPRMVPVEEAAYPE